jgi:hypothetical protein
MASPIDETQFLLNLQQAREAAEQEITATPKAVDANYDVSTHLIVVRLHNGAVFSFPPDIAQGLAGAEAEDLAAVEITPSGTGLHWERLDADFTVSGLLNGVFGTRVWMAQLQERWQGQQAS